MANSKKSTEKKTESKVEKVAYKKVGFDAEFEDVEYLQDHGAFKKKDKRSVHPNVAILLRNKRIAK